MVLHRQPDVDNVEGEDSERVALKQRDVHYVKESQGKQFPDAHVLRRQRERGRVLVVHLVKGAIQPRHLVVQHVPHEDFGVEEQQAEHDMAHQLQQLGGFGRQQRGGAGPMQQSHREHEHHVLVERLPQAGQQLQCRRQKLWVDLVAPQRGHPGIQDVQHHEGQAESHVGGDGEDHREEGGPSERLPGLHAVPERLQEQLAGAAKDLELGAVVAAHGEVVSGAAAAAASRRLFLGLAPPSE